MAKVCRMKEGAYPDHQKSLQSRRSSPENLHSQGFRNPGSQETTIIVAFFRMILKHD